MIMVTNILWDMMIIEVCLDIETHNVDIRTFMCFIFIKPNPAAAPYLVDVDWIDTFYRRICYPLLYDGDYSSTSRRLMYIPTFKVFFKLHTFSPDSFIARFSPDSFIALSFFRLIHRTCSIYEVSEYQSIIGVDV